MEYKKQHFVTASYLKAWCDPKTPRGQSPYAWVVSKDLKEKFNKAPQNIFKETDFYTVFDTNGNRILDIEKQLHDIEDDFISLRRNILAKRHSLSPENRKVIAVFVATMFARTEFQKNLQKEMWQEIIDFTQKLPEEILSEIKNTNEYKIISNLRDQPMPFHLFNFVNIAWRVLFYKNIAIYETDDPIGFLTSDNPCLWFDPAVFEGARTDNFYGLSNPKLCVQLPISPTQFISLKTRGSEGYLSISKEPKFLDHSNSFIVLFCNRYIISNREEINKDWFIYQNK